MNSKLDKEAMKEKKASLGGNKEYLLRGRMIHSKLMKPSPDNKGRLKYSMQFFWKEDCPRNKQYVDEILKLCERFKAQWYPNHKNFFMPIKHYDTYVKQDGSANPTFLKGCFWINASASDKFPPVVFDHNKRRITDEAELTDGRNCLASFQLYPYDVQGNVGINLGLRAVILMPGGDVPYGNEPVDPDVLFGGAVQEEIDKAVEQNEGEVAKTVGKDIPF